MAETSTLAPLNRWARGMAKSVAARTGGVRLYHRLRDREALTVIMLHRVLPRAVYGAVEPDPCYTISTELLRSLVAFLRANYTIVSLSAVLDARRGVRPLPSHPLLITSDDGWDDNLRYAAPIFSELRVPWTLFVAAGAVGVSQTWWQETLLKALRTGRVSYPELWRMASAGTSTPPQSQEILALLNSFAALDPQRRDNLLAPFLERKSAPDMADWNGLRALDTYASVGAHGFSHLPLTTLDDPARDLLQARELLRSNLGPGATASMSFPHGRYDAKILTAARALGFELMFTSDAVLNSCPGGWLNQDRLGRISVEESQVCDLQGEFDSGQAERWLMLRKRQAE
jgi:peptidoglycan/xylan/chitin deacetylase (PgdA/CDA1 family)